MNREFWMQRGVIPRWQYLLVYVLIVSAGIFGFSQIQGVANRADNLSIKIQEQRVNATRDGCEAQNERFGDIVMTLRELNPRIKLMVAREFAGAVAPVRNCERVVRQVTGRASP